MLREGAGSREHRVLDSHLCSTDRCPMLEGLGGVLSPVPETSPLFYILCIIVCLRGGGQSTHVEIRGQSDGIIFLFCHMNWTQGVKSFLFPPPPPWLCLLKFHRENRPHVSTGTQRTITIVPSTWHTCPGRHLPLAIMVITIPFGCWGTGLLSRHGQLHMIFACCTVCGLSVCMFHTHLLIHVEQGDDNLRFAF